MSGKVKVSISYVQDKGPMVSGTEGRLDDGNRDVKRIYLVSNRQSRTVGYEYKMLEAQRY